MDSLGLQCNQARSALQAFNTVQVKLHAQEVAFACQNTDVLVGKGDTLLVPQEETVQEDGLLHTVLHHEQWEGGGS